MTGVVTREDVMAAQAAVDLLRGDGIGPDTDQAALAARGILAGLMADVRTAGYLEGIQRGRRETAHVVLDALRGEGLAP